jgi:hypothetical protein
VRASPVSKIGSWRSSCAPAQLISILVLVNELADSSLKMPANYSIET